MARRDAIIVPGLILKIRLEFHCHPKAQTWLVMIYLKCIEEHQKVILALIQMCIRINPKNNK